MAKVGLGVHRGTLAAPTVPKPCSWTRRGDGSRDRGGRDGEGRRVSMIFYSKN